MQNHTKNCGKREDGFATLTISVVILLLLTLVTLYTMRTTTMERRIVADQHRADQALSVSNAALDYAIAYYNSGGVYQNGCLDPITGLPVVDFPSGPTVDNDATNCNGPHPVSIIDIDDEMSVKAQVHFSDVNLEAITIAATGYSDDQTAQRTISVNITDAGLFGEGEGGPDFPVISRTATNLSGNFTIINRHTHKAVWTGANEETWGSAATYLAKPDVTIPDMELVNPDEYSDWSIPGTRAASGINSDIIASDPNLLNLEPDDFFFNFLKNEKERLRRYAADDNQRFDSSISWDDLIEKEVKGIVWVDVEDGDEWSPSGVQAGETVGTTKDPVLLIIDGNFEPSGFSQCDKNHPDVSLVGILYVTGIWNLGGNFCIQGSSIVEQSIEGNGTPKVIYDPNLFGSGSGDRPYGIKGVVAGTWRDWTD